MTFKIIINGVLRKPEEKLYFGNWYLGKIKLPRKHLYRASYIILDYLQALTPKYAHDTRKTEYFLQENFYKNLLYF